MEPILFATDDPAEQVHVDTLNKKIKINYLGMVDRVQKQISDQVDEYFLTQLLKDTNEKEPINTTKLL